MPVKRLKNKNFIICMRQIIILLNILILFTSINAYSQDTKRKRVKKGIYTEDYYVLKNKKKVKHGQYIKFQEYFLTKIPIEIGFYDYGIKVSEWYYFYSNGALKSFGSYNNGKKFGVWKEFYKPGNIAAEMLETLQGKGDASIDENGVLAVEINDRLISATGVYESDKKIGIWNYYGQNGNFIHQYDHSSNSLLMSSVLDSINQIYPYLGGIDRFLKCYFEGDEIISKIVSTYYSKVYFRISYVNNSFVIERISSTGDKTIADKTEQLLRSIPNDWIPKYFEKPLILIMESEKNSNAITVKASFNPETM